MAQQAITESCALCSPQKIIPTLLALPELTPKTQNELASDFNGLAQEIINICQPWVCAEYFRTIHGGRCAGIAALDFAFKYLANEQHDYVLIGASDSHIQLSRLDDLDVHNRLLTEKNSDGFVVGEGACFLMLTRHPRLAEQRDGCIVALHPPGIAHEAGHLYSSEPCLGAGLDQAYKSAISHYYSSGSTNGDKISAIYSGINGERYWSKESGVARLRNRAAFLEAAAVYHPADCVGDLGAATSTLLIALAAEHLLRHKNETRHLIASSSDYGGRGAVVIEKIPI
jgi:3-oxoacyl-[acyl-carrier-protein] synthase I